MVMMGGIVACTQQPENKGSVSESSAVQVDAPSAACGPEASAGCVECGDPTPQNARGAAAEGDVEKKKEATIAE